MCWEWIFVQYPCHLIFAACLHVACVVQQKDARQWFAELSVDMEKVLFLPPATCYGLTRYVCSGYKPVLHVCDTDLNFIQRSRYALLKLGRREKRLGHSVITLPWKSRLKRCIMTKCCWWCHFSDWNIKPISHAFFLPEKKNPGFYHSTLNDTLILKF